MPRNFGSGTKYAKSPRTAKKGISKYAKAQKTAKRKVQSAKRSRAGSASVKKLALANATQIAKLKKEKYGPIQTNTSTTKDDKPIMVTDQRPLCVHMNNLYSTIHSPKVIQGKYMIRGEIANVMNDYGVQDFHRRVPMHMGKVDEVQDEPSGKELLWLNTRFDIKVQGWCARTVLNFYIVKQKVGKPQANYDPWDTLGISPKPAYLPYTLPQWRETAGPWPASEISNKQYTILKKKSCYLNSIGEIPPLTSIGQAAHIVKDLVVGQVGEDQHHDPKPPTTPGEKYVSISYSPKQVLKMLRDPVTTDGDIDEAFMADKEEGHVLSNWGYNNQDPSANCFLIITTSDAEEPLLGGNPSNHNTTVVIRRTNTWRDLNDESHIFRH